MFTGLIEDLGAIGAVAARPDGVTLSVRTRLAGELSNGDSIAVAGVCLTAAGIEPDGFRADVMNETLRRSTLAAVAAGAAVNLELPLRASDRLGGHLVQGHVDAVGTVRAVRDDGIASVVEIECPADQLRYVVRKGSVAVDGVSLTVAAVDEEGFSVSLIPETRARTTLGAAQPGTRVNIETDVLAKYVEKLVPR